MSPLFYTDMKRHSEKNRHDKPQTQLANAPTKNGAVEFGFVCGKRLLEIIFPEKDSRPSLRSLERYVRRRIVPSVKLGRKRFYSPEQVREVLLGKQGARVSTR